MDEDVRERDAGCSLNKLLRQLVALPVWHREWREDRDREQHSEMLARLKEFNEDVDKLFAECKQDTESDPDECNQELKDCVPEPRQILRRMSRQESLRMCLRVQVCFRESLRGVVSSMDSIASTRRARSDSGPAPAEHRQPQLQEDARTDCPQQCCSERSVWWNTVDA